MIDHELGADVKALLAAGRDHLGPDTATIARLRSRIDTSVTGAPAAAAKAVAIKLTLVAVTAVVGAGIVRYIANRPTVETPRAVQIVVDDEPIEIETRGSLASHEAAPPPSDVPAAPLRAPAAVAIAVEPTIEDAVALPQPEPGISLAREIELVDRAALGLRRRDLDSALVALRSYGDETKGRGQLAQDAAAIEVEVLCRRSDATAGAQLTAFEQHWPASAHRSHLRAICAHREEKK